MARFHFLHAADLHLDSTFLGLRTATPDHVAQALEAATFSAFGRLVALAIERQVSFVVVAGDVYDGEDRSLRAQLRFRDGLKRLSEAGIESFVVFGNHDPLSGWSARIEWPDRAYLFGADCVEVRQVRRDGQLLAVVHGISHPRKQLKDNLARQFLRDENYAPCSRDDLDAARMDYWALGHVHTRTEMALSEGRQAAYPGNTQGRSRAEKGERGCFLVSVDGAEVDIEFAALDAVRWAEERVRVDGLAEDEELLVALGERCRKLQDEADGRPVVCTIRLVGSSPLHGTLARAGYADHLLEELREEHASDDRFVWVDRLEVATRPEIDRDARKLAGDFAAELLTLVDEISSSPEQLQALSQELQPLREQLNKLPPALAVELPERDEDLLEWLARAEVICLDLLEGTAI